MDTLWTAPPGLDPPVALERAGGVGAAPSPEPPGLADRLDPPDPEVPAAPGGAGTRPGLGRTPEHSLTGGLDATYGERWPEAYGTAVGRMWRGATSPDAFPDAPGREALRERLVQAFDADVPGAAAALAGALGQGLPVARQAAVNQAALEAAAGRGGNPTYDYRVRSNGDVEAVRSADDAVDVYRVSFVRTQAIEHLATLDVNASGLVRFPDAGPGFSRYGTVDRGGTSGGEVVGPGDRYLLPEVAAALFGMTRELSERGITLALGDMSSSNGSDPWQRGFSHHAGHGHNGNRTGLDVDFRYVGADGLSFQSRQALTDGRFSEANNQLVYDVAAKYGFTVNYQGTNGPDLDNARRVGGHNDHGHLGYGR